jgi:hypothetical protein
MITNADIVKLAKVLATKEDIRDLSERVDKVEVSLNSLTITVDGLVRKVDKIDLENTAIKHHLKLI